METRFVSMAKFEKEIGIWAVIFRPNSRHVERTSVALGMICLLVDTERKSVAPLVDMSNYNEC